MGPIRPPACLLVGEKRLQFMEEFILHHLTYCVCSRILRGVIDHRYDLCLSERRDDSDISLEFDEGPK